MLPEGEGLDITGDGIPDNAMGFIAPLANQAIQDGLDLGTGLYLLDVTKWDGPPVATDTDIGLTFYAGIDADEPADVSNNYDGEGGVVQGRTLRRIRHPRQWVLVLFQYRYAGRESLGFFGNTTTY